MEPAERDARVGEQMNGVPPFVRQPSPHDHDRRGDDCEQQRGADRRCDHAGVDPAAEHRRELLRERELVEQRVAPDAEHDVGEHEVDARVAVPAVPDAQTIEAGQPLQHRQPRQQDDLEEREIRRQQARDAGDARQDVAARACGEIAAVHPEPDDRDRVSDQHRPDERAGGDAA